MRKSNAGNRVLGDVMSMLFMGTAAICVLMLALINETAKKSNDDNPPPQGQLMVELFWPDELNTDVDLWVMTTADGIPVGYSNKGASYLNLLRDDLGLTADVTKKNMEILYSRGLPDGEYVINAQLYANLQGTLPVPIMMVASTRNEKDGKSHQIIQVKTELKMNGQELTLARFMIKDGALVPNSVNHFPMPLRSKGMEQN